MVLNSQIMNSLLPEATEQEEWLEHDLAAMTGKRIFLFLHLPPSFTTAPKQTSAIMTTSANHCGRADLVQRHHIRARLCRAYSLGLL
ncbi:MAG: hypothetical protein R2932_36775 [Caldilineaceae bacterium]